MRGRLHQSLAAGLGLAATLVWAVAGCGGDEKADEGVVTVPAPTVSPAQGGGEATGGGATGPAGGGPETAKGDAATKPAEAATAPAAKGATASGWGTLKGRVVFGGDPPASKVLRAQGKAEKDPDVCGAKAPIPSERLVVDSQSKGVKFALVYIPRPTAVNPEAEAEARKAPAVFDQKGCVFFPHVLAVMEKATVQLKSSDSVGHNVNHTTVANNGGNESVLPGGSLPYQTRAASKRVGEVTCNIHPWMKAWWYVANNPYFAVTDAQGNFEIKNVPAGEQKVVVWQEAVHPSFVTPGSGESIAIKANETTTHEFTIRPDQVKPEAGP